MVSLFLSKYVTVLSSAFSGRCEMMKCLWDSMTGGAGPQHVTECQAAPDFRQHVRRRGLCFQMGHRQLYVGNSDHGKAKLQVRGNSYTYVEHKLAIFLIIFSVGHIQEP